MDVEKSYFAVSRFFDTWVRMIEYDSRKMEVSESARLGSRRLIISPPTDAGIPLLVQANAGGRTELLCFSDRIERIAADYRDRRGMKTLITLVKPFFNIPAPDEVYSAVYANCLFDFCAEADIDPMLREIRRVLSPGGILFAVHMGPPSGFGGRAWVWTLKRFSFRIDGAHPVSIGPHLARGGFRILKDLPAGRLGFPARTIVSEFRGHRT